MSGFREWLLRISLGGRSEVIRLTPFAVHKSEGSFGGCGFQAKSQHVHFIGEKSGAAP